MNQLFYNIAGGIVHQIRREKRTITTHFSNSQSGGQTMVVFSPERNEPFTEMQNTEMGCDCDCCISLDCEANRDGADAEPPFPLFFSFSASSSPREKVAKLSSFRDSGGPSLCSHYIVTKYNIFLRASNDRSREKKYLLTLSACTHAYV